MTRTATIVEDLLLGEHDDQPFGFGSSLRPGEALVEGSVQVTCRTYRGTDAAPQAMLDGAWQLDGSQVLQRIVGRTAGCVYLLECAVVTSLGRRLSAVGLVRVVDATALRGAP